MQVIWYYDKHCSTGEPTGNMISICYNRQGGSLFNYLDRMIDPEENCWIVPNTIPEKDL